MYVDTETQRDPSYNDNLFNGIRIEDIDKCRDLPKNPPEEHSMPIRQIHERSIIVISHSSGQEETIYKPYYVHRYIEDTGLLVCEDCRNPKRLFVEGGDGDQHFLSPNKYETVMSKLVERDELEYALATYPLSMLNLIDEEHEYVSAHKEIASDNWVIDNIDSDPEVVRYYI